MFKENQNSFLEFHQNWYCNANFFYVDFSNYILRCSIFFLNARELHKMYHFIFKCPEPKQKLYCFIFIWALAKRTIQTQSCYDSSVMPQENHMVLFSGFIQYMVFLQKFEIYGFFSSQWIIIKIILFFLKNKMWGLRVNNCSNGFTRAIPLLLKTAANSSKMFLF